MKKKKSKSDFLKSYSTYLETSSEHLTYQVLSIYIDLPNELSEKEKHFIEKHLESCQDCQERFNRVFDEYFEFDDEFVRIPLSSATLSRGGEKFFKAKGFKAMVKTGSKNQFSLIFKELPQVCFRKKIQVILPEAEAIVRLRHADTGKEYHFEPNKPMTIATLQRIEVGTLAKTSLKEGESQRHKSPLIPYLKYAAILVLVFGIAIILRLLMNRSEEPPIAGEESPPSMEETTETTKMDEQLLAQANLNLENFQPHPVLENFVDRRMRSEETIEILFPQNSDTLYPPITFKWEVEEGARQFTVTVVDNKNKVIRKISTNKSSIYFDERLTSGLYYWKIEEMGKLIEVRKFYVIQQQ